MVRGRPDHTRLVVPKAEGIFSKKISVTDSDTPWTPTKIGIGYWFYNEGPNAVFFETDAVVDSESSKIPSGGTYSEGVPVTILHFKCASDETATVYARSLI